MCETLGRKAGHWLLIGYGVLAFTLVAGAVIGEPVTLPFVDRGVP